MSTIRKSRAKKAQIFGGILAGVIIILFAGHLIPGFSATAPSPATVVDLTCPPSCPEGITNPQEITKNENGTSTVSFDPNPPVTSIDSLLLQLADNVQSPIFPTSDTIILTAITTLEDSVGNQKISVQQTELGALAVIVEGIDLQNLNNGRIITNFFVESKFPMQSYFVSGKIFNEDKSIDIILVDSGITDENGNFQIEINNSPAILEGIQGDQLVYSYNLQDLKITIGSLQFGFDGVQQVYRLDVTVDANGFINFSSDSTEPIRFLPTDNSLTFSSNTNEQFLTISCNVMSALLPDCLDDETAGNVIQFTAPSISSITVTTFEIIEFIDELQTTNGQSLTTILDRVPLNSGQTLQVDLNRASAYQITVGVPIDTSFIIQTPLSQKDYSYKCWVQQDYINEFTSVTNGTMKTRTLDGIDKVTCDFPEIPDFPTDVAFPSTG